MSDHPRTKAEAQLIRYGAWAGNPRGEPYRSGHCAYKVWGRARGMISSQCSRLNGVGPDALYCTSHAKKFAP